MFLSSHRCTTDRASPRELMNVKPSCLDIDGSHPSLLDDSQSMIAFFNISLPFDALHLGGSDVFSRAPLRRTENASTTGLEFVVRSCMGSILKSMRNCPREEATSPTSAEQDTLIRSCLCFPAWQVITELLYSSDKAGELSNCPDEYML